MRAVSKKRARLNRERKQLRDVLVEEQAPCEAHLEGCDRLGTDWHEVRTRARRGSIVDPANRLWLCRWCHDVITRNSGKVGWAIRHGFVVASWDPPAALDVAARIRISARCAVGCEVDHRDYLRCSPEYPCDGRDPLHILLFGECWSRTDMEGSTA